MINWFDMPAEGLSNGGQFEVKELEVTENGTYEEKGEMYNKVVVNVEGGGGSSDFSTATVSINIIGGSRTNQVNFDGIAFLLVGPDENTFIATDPSFYNPETMHFVLYQGHALAELIQPDNFTITNVSTEGDVSVVDNVYVNIRGNGSITITITAD